jgi:hypothetical protein
VSNPCPNAWKPSHGAMRARVARSNKTAANEGLPTAAVHDGTRRRLGTLATRRGCEPRVQGRPYARFSSRAT